MKKSPLLVQNNLDCLLVSPPSKFSRYPYLGLCNIASVLRQRGIRVAILDCAAWKLTEIETVKLISAAKPMIIGISVMSLDLVHAYPIIQGLKTIYPQGIIVVGGSHINADPGIIQAMGVEYGFWGESDLVFADFCEQMIANRQPDSLPGLILHREGKVVTQAPTIIEDLDQLPDPAYDLVPLDKYFSINSSGRPMAMNTSRGCPYNCIFCSKLQKTAFRAQGINKTIHQINWLTEELRIDYIEFVDELFTLKKERVLQLCQAIIQEKIHISWGCNARADVIGEELVAAMRAAGCIKISLGVETGSERIRFLDHKKISNEQYFQAVRLCQKHKIKVMGFFIFGHPQESLAEMKETLSFSKKLQTDQAYFHKMIPIPNSELFEQAKENGQIASDLWTQYMLGKIEDPIYYPVGISAKTVHGIYRQAWWNFYLSKRQTKRYLGLFLHWTYLLRTIKLFVDTISAKRYHK